jgi:hypothetical protein
MMKTRSPQDGFEAAPCRPAAEPETVQARTAGAPGSHALETSAHVAAQRRVLEGLGLAPALQRMPANEEEEEPLQAKADEARGGLPGTLRRGMEALSGMDLSDVRVHRDSARPAQLNAHAYAQGNEIHLAPGQEQHLPHEAWHVVQQRQGRVQPTLQVGGVDVNDDTSLESEADAMGGRAAQMRTDGA